MKLYRIVDDIHRFEIDLNRFHFPDGQPHVQLEEEVVPGGDYLLQTAITNTTDLFTVAMIADVIHAGGGDISLDVTYLMAARMDRRMDATWPFTLKVVADILNSCNFKDVHILDPHSMVSTALINGAMPIYPHASFAKTVSSFDPDKWVIVIPDLGARERVNALLAHYSFDREEDRGKVFPVVQAIKERNPLTGKVECLGLLRSNVTLTGKNCLIVDDLCDGGATFVQLAKVLRKEGAATATEGAVTVNLFVTHGLFTKGPQLEGINHIYTTDSYYFSSGPPSDINLTSNTCVSVWSSKLEFE